MKSTELRLQSGARPVTGVDNEVMHQHIGSIDTRMAPPAFGMGASHVLARRHQIQWPCVAANAETQKQRRRRDFEAPPPPPPPPPRRPPPPPPPAAADATIDRRVAIAGGGAAILALVALLSGGGNMSTEYERDLSYVASQVGVSGMPSPVSAIVDRQGRIAGLDVVGKYGNYVATVDPKSPSTLILKARNGSVYRLPTRYERINLADRRAMESIFRVSDWERALI